jgi:hypothetical protein
MYEMVQRGPGGQDQENEPRERLSGKRPGRLKGQGELREKRRDDIGRRIHLVQQVEKQHS